MKITPFSITYFIYLLFFQLLCISFFHNICLPLHWSGLQTKCLWVWACSQFCESQLNFCLFLVPGLGDNITWSENNHGEVWDTFFLQRDHHLHGLHFTLHMQLPSWPLVVAYSSDVIFGRFSLHEQMLQRVVFGGGQACVHNKSTVYGNIMNFKGHERFN